MSGEKVILIPIDNRPVTYQFPQMIASVAGLEAIVPPPELMGSQGIPADFHSIIRWLEESLPEIKPAALFVCLDAILYGGLGPSRRSNDSLAEVSRRAGLIARWKGLAGSDLQIFAQASVMRIPHYSGSSEEPQYWQQYGEKIFRWSALKHKEKLGLLETQESLRALDDEIPKNVRDDFSGRRERNFQINQSLIAMAKEGAIDFLVFSQDDTAEFGLNVWEKTQLVEQANKVAATNVVAYPGADETIATLMTRWLTSRCPKPLRAAIQFSPERGEGVASNYEGQTIGKSVNAVARVSGLEIHSSSEGNTDLVVVVHTAGELQGDHTKIAVSPDLLIDTAKQVENTIGLLEQAQVPVILCDVAFSNGADPLLVEALFRRKDLLAKLCAYAGWNTTNNTVGSALALGVARWFGQSNHLATEEAFKRALYVRFADDWAYQTTVRSQLNGLANDEKVRQLMVPLLHELNNALDFDPGRVELRLPWKRTFEIEVGLPPVGKAACSSGKN
jgi:hypothetical protein